MRGTEHLARALEALPHVGSVRDFAVEGGMLRHGIVETRSAGVLTAKQLEAADAPGLYDFYFAGLSEPSRRNFVPYPLFHTPPVSPGALAERIAEWRREDDWSAILLAKVGQVVGFGLLKRIRSEHVTSGLAIRDDCAGKGLGHLVQILLNGQARMLNVKRFHVKIVSDNLASIRLHEKCGFRRNGVVPWDGYEELRDYLARNDPEGVAVDRHMIRWVIELNDE